MNLKRVSAITITFFLLAILFFYPLELYISKPGGAYDLAPLVDVVDGDDEDIGTFSLMTISLTKATAATYIFSRFSDKRKILPVENVRRSGENDAEYNVRQKKMMTESQFNAIMIAFEKAGLPVQNDFGGVFVMNVLEDGASAKVLEPGDKIHSLDGIQLKESGAFVDWIAEKEIGDEVKMSLERDGKLKEVSVLLKEIPGGNGRAGLGIHFQEDRTLTTDPEVIFQTSNIGGPSAGLLFTLEIMNQLIDGDISKGYNIAGTGEMLEDGTVGRIGGADFKVIAATRDGVEIFFAPDDDLPQEVKDKNPGIQTNYEEAVKMAEKLGTKMKIVPVKNIDDALDYLQALEPKT